MGQALFPTVMGCNPQTAFDFDYYWFKCFEDDSFAMYNPSNEDCEYLLTHLDIEDNNEILDSEPAELYPNPVENELTISASNYENRNQVTIVNILGEIVGRYTVNSNQQKFDVSNLEKGVYFVRIENGSTLKFIKN